MKHLERLDDAGLKEHSTAVVLCRGSRRVGVGVTPRKDPADAERTLPQSGIVCMTERTAQVQQGLLFWTGIVKGFTL